jgi:GcrA cell cycle regulator
MSIPPRIRVSNWTPERDALLRRLWDSGMTTRLIGIEMGITKSAAIGRASRIHLPARPSPVGARGEPRPPRAPHVAKVAASPSVKTPAAIAPFVPFRDCQWPTSAGPPWAFCAAPAVPGCPYCETHAVKSRVQHRTAA